MCVCLSVYKYLFIHTYIIIYLFEVRVRLNAIIDPLARYIPCVPKGSCSQLTK